MIFLSYIFNSLLLAHKAKQFVITCLLPLVFFAACSDMGERDNPFDVNGTTFEDYWGFDYDEDENESSGSSLDLGLTDGSSSSVEKDLFEIVDGPKSSSSAQRGEFVIVNAPSSSAVRITGAPSSSSVKVITGLGMCEPVTTPIDKGTGSTKWKFTPNLNAGYKAVAFAKATYAWNFGAGATPATDATPSTSVAVSYANSGTATASVTITLDGGSEMIQCEPLQVNGDPITGCKCTAEATSVDYTVTSEVTWSVTGCMSASMPLTYNWNGTDGSESYTHSFTAATASYAPKLKVGNTDNTVVDVKCDATEVVSPWKCGDLLVRDALSYKTVEIKGRCWTKQNMRYTPTAGKSICYDGKDAICATYGLLYDYEAANLACPSGWRLPTSDEYIELQEYTGKDMYDAGACFKTTTSWVGENGTDELEFSGLPGGRCDYAESCSGLGERGYWWTSTEVVKNTSHYTLFLNGDGSTFSATTQMDNVDYASVRCVKIE